MCFGGLWTDRTDAAAVLKGKTAIGQIGSAAAAAIAPLVHSGISVFASGAKLGSRQTPAEFAASMVDDQLTLAVLRAVLEDNPIVLNASNPETENPAQLGAIERAKYLSVSGGMCHADCRAR